MLARAQAGSGGASTEGAEENPFKDSADTSGECYQWAADGQCGSNPDFMLSSCKYSCWEWFDFRGKKYPGSPMCAALRHPAQRTWHAAPTLGPAMHTHARTCAHTRPHSPTLVHARARLLPSPSHPLVLPGPMEHRAPMRLTCCSRDPQRQEVQLPLLGQGRRVQVQRGLHEEALPRELQEARRRQRRRALSKASWPACSLRPAWLAGGCFQRQSVPQVAPSSGQAQPNSRLGRAGRSYRACFRHVGDETAAAHGNYVNPSTGQKKKKKKKKKAKKADGESAAKEEL